MTKNKCNKITPTRTKVSLHLTKMDLCWNIKLSLTLLWNDKLWRKVLFIEKLIIFHTENIWTTVKNYYIIVAIRWIHVLFFYILFSNIYAGKYIFYRYITLIAFDIFYIVLSIRIFFQCRHIRSMRSWERFLK